MGHSEMLLAVAGLDEKALQKRTKKLSTGDWSGFPAAERLAFQFAHKQAQEPWNINDNDVDDLIRTAGQVHALDLIWYGAWCNYMTRVADAFQLPLERENVFGSPRKKKAKKN